MSTLQTLLDGYRRFRTTGYRDQRQRWNQLAQGQAPKVMVIGCADSRVDPAAIFDCAPGELFVVRNVANLVPPFERGGGRHGVSAAIEFAVLGLKVEHVVVLGHGACGGVTAALHGHDLAPRADSFLTSWIELLEPARARVLAAGGDDLQRALEQEGVRQSLANLRTFPFVCEAEAAGRLALHGAHFGIADGVLELADEHGFVAVRDAG